MKRFEDEEILNLIADASQEAYGFKLLVSQYQRDLYRHVIRMVGNHEDTNDVLQNTFMKAYKNISRFERKAKLYTWLYKIASNESINFLKKSKRRRSIDIDDVSSQLGLKYEGDIDGEYIMASLQKATDILPPKQKLVFNMRYFDEMSYKEISDVLGTSVGALKASYHHALKKIESHLKMHSL